MQKPIVRQYAESGYLGTFHSKWDVSTKSLQSGIREPWGRGNEEVESVFEPERMENKKPSKHNRTDSHMNSQRLGQHTQGLHESAPDGVLGLKREENTYPQSLTQKLAPTYNNLQMKISFSPREFLWGTKLLLMVGHMSTSRWPREKHTQQHFWRCLV